MTIKATKFNPEVLLSAPRRSPGKPNSDGTKVLYSISTYSFSKHERKQEIRLLYAGEDQDGKKDLPIEAQFTTTQSFNHDENGFVQAVDRKVLGDAPGMHALDKSACICDGEGVSGFDWLDDRLIYVCMSDKEKPGATDIWIGEAGDFEHTKYRAGTVDAEIDEIKVKELEKGEYIFAFAAKTSPDGKLFNAEKAVKPHTSGRLYNELFVRHWDQYITKERNAIWYGTLSFHNDTQSDAGDAKYLLSSITNALKDTGLECPFYQPTGSDVLWDIAPTGLVFVAKDPTLSKAVYTKQNLYICATDKQIKDSFSFKKPYKVTLSGFEGATSNPVISPDGVSVAFFSKERKMDEADKNQIWIMPDIHNPQWLHYMYGTFDLRGAWDASPSAMIWGAGKDAFDSALVVVAESWGRHGIYVIPSVHKLRFEDDLNIKTPLALPEFVWLSGAISDLQIIGSKSGPKSLFVSSSNFRDSSLYYRLSYSSEEDASFWHGTPGTFAVRRDDVSSLSKYGKLYGLQNVQFKHFASPGATKAIDSWMILPSEFDSNSKYPLALIVHGGPQGAWTDSWSTRWNPAVFAEQGYVVVCPNPTGSTGYGQKFTDDVRGNFGGAPYIDLFNLMVELEKKCPYIDMERAVALGASYGGYMMNYFQGMPIASMFEALVTHDGIFSCVNHLSTDELFFVLEDMGGVYWDSSPPAQKDSTSSENSPFSSKQPDDQSFDDPKYGLLTSDLDISGLSPWHRWDPAHPTRLARGWKTPHLIIHSDKDYRLPMTEGLSAFNVLQMKGTKSRLLNFPDENHWVLKPENSLLWHKVVLDWINEAVGLPGWRNEGAEGLVEQAGMS